MDDWAPIESVPRDGTRVWLALDNGEVALGRWKANPPRSYFPGHWRTDLGICSDQSDLGNPVAWLELELPKAPTSVFDPPSGEPK